jgi:hypothetical protein
MLSGAIAGGLSVIPLSEEHMSALAFGERDGI